MAATLEISYFNSFWMKTLNGNGGDIGQINPVWPYGYPYNDASNPYIPGTEYAQNVDDLRENYNVNWFIEESRIRGGYNNTQVDYGVKAYIVEDEPEQQHRFNTLIYSGIYNSRTGVNDTNEFSVGKDITKSVDPAYGSIQKLFSADTNITIFQESKVSSALIDKDAIYTAEGSPMQTTSNIVIGQVQPYLGEYGISRNPESFAYYGFQKYFADKDRGVILRLSRDGITEISQYGMTDYFRDNLKSINEENYWVINTGLGTQTSLSNVREIDVVGVDLTKVFYGMQILSNDIPVGYIVDISISTPTTGVVFVDTDTAITGTDIVKFQAVAPGKILGTYDIHNKNYVLSLQQTPQYSDNSNYSTLAFDELINGWVSFYSYKPTQFFSLRDNLFSNQYANIWKHYSDLVNRTSFYGIETGANITFIFNQDSSINKVFQTINYEGDNGWQVDSFISEPTGYDLTTTSRGWVQYSDQIQNIKSYYEGQYIDGGIKYYSGFNRKENKYYANLINTSTAKPNEIVFGESMSGIKGRFATVKFSTDSTTDPGGSKELWSVGTKVNYIR